MHVLITAGPTREPIDAVRFISNRSSGRLGVALAEAALDGGHQVTLLIGPVMVHGDLAQRCGVHRFETCAELEALLAKHFPKCDLLIMAAAVADYRPLKAAKGKIARQGGNQGQQPGTGLTISLEPTPDLVAALAGGKGPGQRIVAFALEADDQLEERARAKLQSKAVDALVANPLATMEAGDIDPLLLTPDGGREAPGTMDKSRFAAWLIQRFS